MDWWDRCARWGILDEGLHRLSLIRSKRSDVDEAGYFGVVASLSDDDATIGVTNEDDRSILGCKRPLCYGHIICQREGRLLADRVSISNFLSRCVDAFAAGAVY